MTDRADATEVVRRGYDALSWRYRADDASAANYGPWIDELLTSLTEPSRVLDVGCGCGIPVSRDLAAAGHEVIGVDVSEVQVQRARKLVPAATFIQADVTTLEFPSRSYDAVVSLYSIIHVPLQSQPTLLRSIANWLVDDGLLLLTAGWESWTGSEPSWLDGNATMWWSHADVDTYRRWLNEAGFRVLREEFVPQGETGHSLFWVRRAERAGMFERFTNDARRVIVMAQEAARRLDHNYIGTEHILLGLRHADAGIAAEALDRLGISPAAVQAEVQEVVGRGQLPPVGHIPFTPRVKEVIELSWRAAAELNHDYVGTEHILLGLISEREGTAAQVLVNLGVDLDAARAVVIGLVPAGSAGGEGAGGSRRRDIDREPQRRDTVAELRDEIDGLQGEIARLRQLLTHHGITADPGD
ncbi:MAG: hypothetical protein DLM56_14180 [Pseudonocardiales bacterium]|nr:MAG: hypothetical protein DLM56_14180 [Pseudonocardiales bacterium]